MHIIHQLAMDPDELPTLQDYIQKNEDIDLIDEETNMTPIDYAARFGSLETVKYLLSQGASLDASESNKQNLLYYALHNENKSILDYIANHHDILLKQFNDGTTAFHLFSAVGCLHDLEVILDAYQDAITIENNKAWNALHFAVYAKASDTVNFFLEDKGCCKYFISCAVSAAKIYLYRGQIQEAFQFLEDITSHYRAFSIDDQKEEEALRIIADLYDAFAYDCEKSKKENFKSLIVQSYQKAEDFLRSISHQSTQDDYHIGKLYYQRALIFIQDRNFDEALLALDEAVELNQVSNDEDNQERYIFLAMCYSQMKIIHDACHRPLDAIAAIRDKIHYVEKIKDIDVNAELSGCYHNIGLLYLQLKNQDQALDAFKKAIPYSEKMKDHVCGHFALAECYNQVSLLLNAKGNDEEAIEALIKSIEYRMEVDDSLVFDDNEINDEQSLQREAEDYGFRCRYVAADGNCFFNAVCDQLTIVNRVTTDATLTPASLRRDAIQYIVAHQEDFIDFMKQDLEPFVAKVKQDGVWANYLMIYALAQALHLKIVIIRSDSAKPNIVESPHVENIIYLGFDKKTRHYFSLIPDLSLAETKVIDGESEDDEIESPEPPAKKKKLDTDLHMPPVIEFTQFFKTQITDRKSSGMNIKEIDLSFLKNFKP